MPVAGHIPRQVLPQFADENQRLEAIARFTNLIANDPAEVTALIADAHTLQDNLLGPYLSLLADYYHNAGPEAFGIASEAQYQAFWTSRLPSVLMRIVSDPVSYHNAQYRNDKIKVIRYALDGLIAVLLHRTRPGGHHDQSDTSNIEQLRTIMDAFPELYDILWANKRLIRFLGCKASVECNGQCADLDAIRLSLIMLFSINIDLYLSLRSNQADFCMRYHLEHILLLCWMYTANDYCEKALEMLESLLACGEHVNIGLIYMETIHTAGLQGDLYAAISSKLRRHNMMDRPLRRLLKFVCNLGAPQFLFASSKVHEHENIFHAMSLACVRQACSGKDDTRLYCDYIELALRIFTIYTKAKETVLTPMPLDVAPGWIEIIPFISEHLLMVIEHNYEFPLETYEYILDYWGAVARSYRNYPENGVLVNRLPQVAERVWYPTLKRLRASRTSDPRRRRQITSLWAAFGRFMGLSEVEPMMTNHVQGCYWQKCFCRDTKPSCHSMRVCKGCWGARYCSRKCQSRDWEEGGHRERCSSERS